MCDKIAILKGGVVVLFGTPKEIQEKFAGAVNIELTVEKPITDLLFSQIKRKFPICTLNADKTKIVISSEKLLTAFTDVVHLIESKHLLVKDANVFMPTLEDAFEKIITG